MNVYNVYDGDELVLKNAKRKELSCLNDGKEINCSLYASKGYRFRDRYLIVLIGKDGKEIRVEKKVRERRKRPEESNKLQGKYHFTMSEIIRQCKEFKIGDRVIINDITDTTDGMKKVKAKVTVVGRYPSGLLVEKKNGIKEMFTYSEIVLDKAVTKVGG